MLTPGPGRNVAVALQQAVSSWTFDYNDFLAMPPSVVRSVGRCFVLSFLKQVLCFRNCTLKEKEGRGAWRREEGRRSAQETETTTGNVCGEWGGGGGVGGEKGDYNSGGFHLTV